MKIFISSIRYFDTKDFKKMKNGETVDMEDTQEVHFSSIDKALAYLKDEIKDFDEEYQILRAVVSEVELDDQEKPWIVHFYDKDLKYLGRFDLDQVTAESNYKKGDWVLFMQGSHLRCGLVDASPECSEVGLIIYEDNNLKDCSPHDHTAEINILEKVSEAWAKEKLPRKYFEGIKRRFREYNPEKD